jgi:hypothetical protein
MSRITIRFENPQALEGFVRLYRGAPGFFGSRNPNYPSGEVRTDRTLMSSTDKWVYLEREFVQDFRKLGQDVAMFGGVIES